MGSGRSRGIPGGRGGQTSLTFLHSRHNIVTVVDGSSAALRNGGPGGVSMLPAPSAGKMFRFYAVGGTPLGDMVQAKGTVEVVAEPSEAFVRGSNGTVEPDVPAHYYCFIACVNRNLSMSCFDTCASCASDAPLNPNWMNLLTCLNCVVCAGPHAINCIKECWFGS